MKMISIPYEPDSSPVVPPSDLEKFKETNPTILGLKGHALDVFEKAKNIGFIADYVTEKMVCDIIMKKQLVIFSDTSQNGIGEIQFDFDDLEIL